MTRSIVLFFNISICITLASCRSNTLATADAQLERGEYNAARLNYRKVYNRLNKPGDRNRRGETARKLAICHSRLNQPAQASLMARNAIRYGQEDPELRLLLGKSLQKEWKYAEALKAFESYAYITGDNSKVAAGIAGCRLAMEQKGETSSRYKVKRAAMINMQRSDYSPAFAGADRDRIYFTTTNRYATGSTLSEITGIKAGDVWMADRDEHGNWRRPEPAEGGINSADDEGTASFSPDGMTMYLTRARREADLPTGTEIWVSHRRDAGWTSPERLHIEGDSIGNYGHPAVSCNGRWLYFTSDRPGGYGGYDIWRVDIANGGEPLNLGNDINTAGNEMFPYIDDNATLYFASDGHPGLGGLDLFSATAGHGSGWQVNHLPAPLNSPADDFGITCENGSKGYFSSNRGDARGYDHIYEYVMPPLNVTLAGCVTDTDGYVVPGARLRIVGDDGSDRRSTIDNDGQFDFPITPGASYAILASADGFLNASQEFTADSAQEDALYNVEFTLAPVNRRMVVENVFYDFDKATLRPESKTALDSLATIMHGNPTIAIELSAHTDRKGSDLYNTSLSERRAKAVVDYLTAECDINPKRLSYRGYGKSQPMVITPRLARLYPQFEEGSSLSPDFIEGLDSDEQRDIADQINRRTEFKITSVDFY